MEDQDTIAALKELAVAYRVATGLDGAFDAAIRNAEAVIAKHEDLKQTPPASIESDAPSEYMRGYSDGLAQAEETIAAAIQRAKAEEREACAALCDLEARWFLSESLDDRAGFAANACAKEIRRMK